MTRGWTQQDYDSQTWGAVSAAADVARPIDQRLTVLEDRVRHLEAIVRLLLREDPENVDKQSLAAGLES